MKTENVVCRIEDVPTREGRAWKSMSVREAKKHARRILDDKTLSLEEIEEEHFRAVRRFCSVFDGVLKGTTNSAILYFILRDAALGRGLKRARAAAKKRRALRKKAGGCRG